MTSPLLVRKARGSILIITVILLAVLSIIGVAAVALSSQERTNASMKTHRDRLVACAQAAQALIKAELLRYGPGYLVSASEIPEITLPDGTVLRAGHYDEDGTVVVSTTVRTVPCKEQNSEEYLDLTNRDSFFSTSGSCYLIFARCIDPMDRELETEFGLNLLF
jgi:hypothetical protein